MDFTDPQEAPGTSQPRVNPTVYQDAQEWASKQRGSLGGMPTAPAAAPPQAAIDPDGVRRWQEYQDPSRVTDSLRATWSDPESETKKYAQAYSSLPLDQKQAGLDRFSKGLEVRNRIGEIKSLLSRVNGIDSGVSGFTQGFFNLFGAFPELGGKLHRAFAGDFKVPLTRVKQDGSSEQYETDGLSMGDAIVTAAQQLDVIDQMKLGDAIDPKARESIKRYAQMAQLGGLGRVIAEFAATRRIAGAAAGAIKGAGPIASGVRGVLNVAAGRVPSSFLATVGPMTAHGAISGGAQALKTFDDQLAKNMASQYLGPGETYDEKLKQEGGFLPRALYGLKGAFGGGAGGFGAGLMFWSAGRLIRSAGKAMLFPPELSDMERRFTTALGTAKAPIRSAIQNLVTTSPRWARVAESLAQGTEWVAGGKTLDIAASLMHGEAPKQLAAFTEDPVITFAVGAGWAYLGHGLGGSGELKPPSALKGEELANWYASKMPKWARGSNDRLRQMGWTAEDRIDGFKAYQAGGEARDKSMEEMAQTLEQRASAKEGDGWLMWKGEIAEANRTRPKPSGSLVPVPPAAPGPQPEVIPPEEAAHRERAQRETGYRAYTRAQEAEGGPASGRRARGVGAEDLQGFQGGVDRVWEAAQMAEDAGDDATAVKLRRTVDLMTRGQELDETDLQELGVNIKAARAEMGGGKFTQRMEEIRRRNLDEDLAASQSMLERKAREWYERTGLIDKQSMTLLKNVQRMRQELAQGKMPDGLEPGPRTRPRRAKPYSFDVTGQPEFTQESAGPAPRAAEGRALPQGAAEMAPSALRSAPASPAAKRGSLRDTEEGPGAAPVAPTRPEPPRTPATRRRSLPLALPPGSETPKEADMRIATERSREKTPSEAAQDANVAAGEAQRRTVRVPTPSEAVTQPSAMRRLSGMAKAFLGDEASRARVDFVSRSKITTEAGTYQFRTGGNAQGDTKRVGEWKPSASGIFTVHDQGNGSYAMVNGHNRLAALDRAIASGQASSESPLPSIILDKSVTPQEARAIGIMQNMRDGTFDLVEGARALRELMPDGVDAIEWLRKQGVNIGGNARKAAALAQLENTVFADVEDNILPTELGVEIGRLLPNDNAGQRYLRSKVMDLAQDTGTFPTLEGVRRMAQEAEKARESGGAFVVDEQAAALDTARDEMLGAVTTSMKATRSTLRRTNENAGLLEGLGSTIDREANAKRSAAIESSLAAAEKLGRTRSALGDMLTDAAGKWLANRAPADRAVIRRQVEDALSSYNPVTDTLSGTGLIPFAGGGSTPKPREVELSMFEQPSGQPLQTAERRPSDPGELKTRVETSVSAGDVPAALAAAEELTGIDRTRALAFVKAASRTRGPAGAKKKSPKAPQEVVGAAEVVAGMPVLPSEAGEAAPPELLHSKDMISTLAVEHGRAELADNGIAGRRAETIADAAGRLQAAFPTGRTPLAQPGHALIRALKGEAAGGYGINREYSPSADGGTRTGQSFWGLVDRVADQFGSMGPEAAWDLASTIYAAPVAGAADGLPWSSARPFKQLTGRMGSGTGMLGLLMAERTPDANARRLLSAEERGRLDPADPESVHLAQLRMGSRAAAAAREYADEISTWPQGHIDAGPLAGTHLASIRDMLHGYGRWLSVAARRGYNVLAPVVRGTKSPRRAWLDAMYHNRFPSESRSELQATERSLEGVLGETDWIREGQPVDLPDLLPFQSFDRLVRAYEVSTGALTQEHLGRYAQIARDLSSGRSMIDALDPLVDAQMDQPTAARIMSAWSKGDWHALAVDGVTTSTVMRRHGVGGREEKVEPPAELAVDKEWQEDPDSHDFRKALAAVDAAVPELVAQLEGMSPMSGNLVWEGKLSDVGAADDLALAREELGSVPREMFLIKEAVDAGDLERARLTFSSLMERVQWDGKAGYEWIDKALDADTAHVQSPLHAEAANAVRSTLAEVLDTIRTNEWMTEEDGTLKTSDRVQMDVIKVRRARGRGEPADEPLRGDNDFMRRVCQSPCALFPETVDEAKKERAWPDRVNTFAGRMKKLLVGDRQSMLGFVSHYAEQLVRPETRQFMDTWLSKLFASARNRFGDVIANHVSKYNEERLNALSKWMPRVFKSLRDVGYSSKPNFYERTVEGGKLTPAEQDEQRDLQMLSKALEGRLDEAALSERARKALPELRSVLDEARQYLSAHIFRDLRKAAEDALKGGRDIPSSFSGSWGRVIGKNRDPQKVLDILDAVTTMKPGATKNLHGVTVSGWGLREYYPHVWAKDAAEGVVSKNMRDPGQEPDAGEPADVKPGTWAAGAKAEKWQVEFVEDYARSHGFMGKRKFMRNLLERLENRDGYVPDVVWALNQYLGRMVDKVIYERFTDDLDPMFYGDYRRVNTASLDDLRKQLSRVPKESTFEKHGAIGSIEGYFGARVRGNARIGKYLVLENGRWKPSEGRGKAGRRQDANRWRAESWRVNSRFTHLEGDPAKWTLGLSTPTETVIFRGRDKIERAGIHTRQGGISSYTDGKQHDALKDFVRRATGYDMESNRWVGNGPETEMSKKLRHVGDAINEMFYQATLGGVINTKAWSVQQMEGFIQNVASLGPSTVANVFPKFRGYTQFMARVLSASNPLEARERARADMADTPYVKGPLKILEAANMKIAHLLRSSAEHEGMSGGEKLAERLRRTSYLAFTMADVQSKEMAYVGAYEKAIDQGEWHDPQSDRVLKIVPEYVGVGDVQRRMRQGEISAHDIARMVMERTHFTMPRWAQPGIVRLPGWSIVGHLGTQATNITAEFWHGLAATKDYVANGSEANLWMAQKTSRYMVGLMAAYWIGQLLGRDLGSYVGSHVSEIGVGDATLGRMFPMLKALPESVRVPGWQLPAKASLPLNFLFSPEPDVGVPALAGSAMLRAMGGDESVPQAFGNALRNWWDHNAQTIGMGPFSRFGRPVVGAMTANRSDLDPDRPYQVRDPWWFGRDPKTRYRNAFDLYFGDVFLPGWSAFESSEHHRSEWTAALNSGRQMVGADLRKQLRAPDEETARAAYRGLVERGFKVDTWRQRKKALLDQLPSYVRRRIPDGDTITKLRTFSDLAAGWAPPFRRLALRYILPADASGPPANTPPELWSNVERALSAPWE